ncbi:MAG TPA: hypothetical protein DHM90_14895 [Clostridiaceae bacterium]|nr:hypothetical protein [Clostridiaceae bacterium]
MEENSFTSKEKKNNKLIKKSLFIVGIVTLVLIVFYFIFQQYNRTDSSNIDQKKTIITTENAEEAYISDTETLMKEFNIMDAYIESIPDGEMAGFKLFRLTVMSDSFEYLSDIEKANFLQKWSAVNYSESKVAVFRTVESNGNVYEFSSGLTLKNGEAFNRETVGDVGIQENYTEPIPLGPEYPKMASGDDKKFAYEAAKAAVLEVLFAPTTAIFPVEIENDDIWEMSPGIFSIQSYGDSQNKFGAMLRFQYAVKIERINWNSYKVLDILIE